MIPLENLEKMEKEVVFLNYAIIFTTKTETLYFRSFFARDACYDCIKMQWENVKSSKPPAPVISPQLLPKVAKIEMDDEESESDHLPEEELPTSERPSQWYHAIVPFLLDLR